MDFKQKLALFNRGIWRLRQKTIDEEKLDSEGLLALLASRNEIIMRYNSVVKPAINVAGDEYLNHCEPLTSQTSIPLKFRAYHCGGKMQPMLVSKSLEFEEGKCQKLDEVYFSLELGDTFTYLHQENSSEKMVYVADARKVQQAWIQKDYQSRVLWDDKLMAMLDLYEKNAKSETISFVKNEASTSHRYCAHFAGKKKMVLMEAIVKEMSDWKIKHALPFNSNRIERYHSKGLDFLLVRGPIKVNY